MTIELIDLILIISSYSALIPLSLSIFGWKRLSFDLRILSAYLLTSFLFDQATNYFAQRSINNHFLLVFFSLIEFSIFSILYYRMFSQEKGKKIVAGLAGVFICFLVIYAFMEGLESYATVPRTVESIVFTLYAIVFLFLVLNFDKRNSAKDESIFWFNSAVLVYFAGSLLFNSLSSFILNNTDHELQQQLFLTPSILNIIQKVLFTISIWVNIARK